MHKLIIFFILLYLSFPLSASAHPGITDSKGGHYDRSTGVYHYHHGYSAHFHSNGQCPYDFDDKTGQNSGTPGSSGISNYQYPSVTATPMPSNTEADGYDPHYSEIAIGIGGGAGIYTLLRSIARKRS